MFKSTIWNKTHLNAWRINAHNARHYGNRMHCLRWAHFNYKTSILPDRWTVGEKSPNILLNLNRQYNATCSVWSPESRTSAKSVFVVIPSVYYFISRNKPLGITSRSQPIDRRDVGHRISPAHYRHYCAATVLMCYFYRAEPSRGLHFYLRES